MAQIFINTKQKSDVTRWFQLVASLYCGEGDNSESPPSLTRWYSTRVHLKISSFTPLNGSELASKKSHQNTVYEWLLLLSLTILRNLSTLFSTPQIFEEIMALRHSLLTFNKSVAVVLCLSSHYHCNMRINYPYEREINYIMTTILP